MKKIWFVISCLAVLASIGCKNPTLVLNQYFEQSIDLRVDPKNATIFEGGLDFKNVYSFPDTRQECDQVACGSHQDCQQVCHMGDAPCHSECFNSTSSCSSATDSSCTSMPNCNTVCGFAPQVCGTECSTVTDYCSQNCHSVAFTNQVTGVTATSPIKIIFEIPQNKVGATGVEKAIFSVLPNSSYTALFGSNPPKDKGVRDVIKQLNPNSKTILLVIAKGLKLSSGQTLLNLPVNFRKGDSIEIHLRMESSGNSSESLSLISTTQEIQDLVTQTQNQRPPITK